MIRFMQTSAAFKKYVLTAILVVICVAMAWYLVPSFTGQGLGITNTNSAVATISGEEVTPEAVRKEAQRELEQQFPRGGAQARSLLPFFAQRAAQQLIEQKVLLVEANRLGLRATDDDVRDFLQQFFCQQVIICVILDQEDAKRAFGSIHAPLHFRYFPRPAKPRFRASISPLLLPPPPWRKR